MTFVIVVHVHLVVSPDFKRATLIETFPNVYLEAMPYSGEERACREPDATEDTKLSWDMDMRPAFSSSPSKSHLVVVR